MSSVSIGAKSTPSLRSGLLLYLLLIIISFNYTHALYTGQLLQQDPWYWKVIKDIPIVLLIFTMFFRGMVTGRIRFPDSPITTSFLFFAIYMVISGCNLGSPLLTRLILLRYLVVYPLLMFVVIDILNRYDRLQRMVRLLQIFSVLVALVGILDFFTLFTNNYFHGMVLLFGHWYPRTISTLGNPNNLGTYMGMMLMTTVALSYCGMYSNKRIYRLQIALYFLCLVFTFSRGSAIAFALSYLWLRVATKRMNFSFLVAGVSLMGVAAVMLTRGVRETESTLAVILQSRLPGWSTTLEAIFSSPKALLIGYGLGFHNDYSSRLGLVEFGRAQLPTDNMYIMLLQDTGFVGLLLFVIFTLSVVMTGLRLYRRSKKKQVRAAGLVCSAVMGFLMINNLFANMFTLFPSSVLIWLLVGGLFSVLKLETRQALPG